MERPSAASAVVPGGGSRWAAALEIAGIFALFFFQGAWPVPDVNEPYYLGKALHFWNPAWLPGDFFLNTADTHKVFYFTFGWLSLWLPLAALAWTGRVLTWGLLAWSWRRLSFAVVPRPWFSWLSAGLLVLLNEQLHMAGEWIIGGVEAKGFAYVLVFLGLEQLVHGRWNRVWPLLGAASALHVLVGGWSAVAAGVAWLAMGGNRPALRSMLPGLAIGLLLALPGLVPSLLLNRGTPREIVQQANVTYVYSRLAHHLVPTKLQNPIFIIRFVALALGWLWLALAATAELRRLKLFVAGALLIALAGGVLNGIAWFYPVWAAGLLKFYWFRLSDVAVPLGVALLLVRLIDDQWLRRPRVSAGLLIVALAGCGYQFVDRLLAYAAPPRSLANEFPHQDAWREACAWVARSGQIPPDACFLTPDENSTFKWYAARAEVVNEKEIPQDAESIVQWWRRRRDIQYMSGTEPEERWFETLAQAGPERLIKMGQKYHAGYAITVLEPRLPLPVVYENRAYIIYCLDK
jgi:hypothetical protein